LRQSKNWSGVDEAVARRQAEQAEIGRDTKMPRQSKNWLSSRKFMAEPAKI